MNFPGGLPISPIQENITVSPSRKTNGRFSVEYKCVVVTVSVGDVRKVEMSSLLVLIKGLYIGELNLCICVFVDNTMRLVIRSGFKGAAEIDVLKVVKYNKTSSTSISKILNN